MAKGLRALVRRLRQVRGPLRATWSDGYEALALVLHHYAKRSVALPLAVQRKIPSGFYDKTEMVRQTRFERIDAAGVPAEWFRHDHSDPTRVLLYFHGGGYSIGSIDSHRDLIARLAHASGFVALAPEYRLAPEHPFPAQLDDALACYRWLIRERGVDPARVIVAGESAGGGLTLGLLVRARELGEPMPAAAVCISPWVDLEMTSASITTNAPFDYISREVLEACATRLLAGGDPRRPLVSPIHADLRGLPPLLLQAGGAEALVDEVRWLAERAREAGVDVTLEVWDDMIHAWHLFAPILRECRPAIERVAAFMNEAMAAREQREAPTASGSDEN